MIEALENISAHAVRRVECAFYCIAVGHALQLSAIGAPGIYIYIYIYISARAFYCIAVGHALQLFAIGAPDTNSGK